MEIEEEENKRFFAIIKVENMELPECVEKTRLHSHISSAVDEAMENIKIYLKNQGIAGKFLTNIQVFAKEETVIRLVETIKAKIKT
ncbi:hypothetical protein [Acidianus manzaensis]|uniref:Uncharacterized protein n=1 Tax=Acidianus manzaensis TaxID=282676 RepID=A0A1W6K3H5_9CREN|nr:hypothetical protein [Acidianus manzaensis]ARM77093.1 hypothetical protein B6F84_06420 [Acidianus manzaensis]